MEGSAIESHRGDMAIGARKVSRWLLKKMFPLFLITLTRMTAGRQRFSLLGPSFQMEARSGFSEEHDS